MSDPARSDLLEFLQRNRERTLVEWEKAVRRLAPARQLEIQELRDHIPKLLDRLIDVIQGAEPERATATQAEQHAGTRLDQGFSLGQIAEEYQVLRATLFRLIESEAAPLEAGALVVLNEAIDHAVARALEHYHRLRARTLGALERVTQEAFASHAEPMRSFLQRFLKVVCETMPDVDSAVIYIREGDRLVVHAAVGVDAMIDNPGLSVGEGFAGTAASEHRPRYTARADADDIAETEPIVAAGIRAMYAAPLIHGPELFGVAQMASRTATAFSEDDRQLFADMAQRAAMVISHRRLVEDREMLLGVLSHDLRNPLNTITIGAGFLATRDLSDVEKRTLDRITHAAARMDRMIGDLSDYTKARFGSGIAVERHVMDLKEMLGQLVGEQRTQNPGREIALHADGDLVGEWDRGRVYQIVANVVRNALAHGDPGTPITISTGSSDGEVEVSVHNKGAPIDPALLPQLFDAFKRGKTRAKGMGLGLFIAQQLAVAHGGIVSVESTREHGTTFTVRLPRWAH